MKECVSFCSSSAFCSRFFCGKYIFSTFFFRLTKLSFLTAMDGLVFSRGLCILFRHETIFQQLATLIVARRFIDSNRFFSILVFAFFFCHKSLNQTTQKFIFNHFRNVIISRARLTDLNGKRNLVHQQLENLLGVDKFGEISVSCRSTLEEKSRNTLIDISLLRLQLSDKTNFEK